MRGRPRAECNDPQVELEDIIEQLGSSFDAFGAVLLDSDIFSTCNYKNIASSFQHTLRNFSALSKIAHLELSESQQFTPLTYEHFKPESQQPYNSAEADTISSQQVSVPLENTHSNIALTASYPSSMIQFGLPRVLSVLAIDYWGDALLSDSGLPFGKLLFRSTLLESHRFLRQKQLNDSNNLGSSRMAHAHAYSFRISNIATMLRVNSISLQAIAMGDEDSYNLEQGKGNDSPITSIAPKRQSDQYFDLDYIHNLGVQLQEEMASTGAHIEDLIYTEEEEAYLLRKAWCILTATSSRCALIWEEVEAIANYPH